MLLDSYLDDELTDEQIEQLRLRLTAERDLADALAQLRRERSLRQRAFETLEPDEASVQQVIGGVRGEIVRADQRQRRWKISRTLSAAAACLIVGLFGGYVARDLAAPTQPGGVKIASNSTPAGQVTSTNVAAANNTNPTNTPANNSDVVSVAANDDTPRELVFPQNQRPYQVVLMDDTGKPIAIQKFRTAEEARRFAQEMNQWQGRPRQHNVVPGNPNSGNIKLVDQLEF